jgi:DNA helicase-2/ATP-dependent DNA helicase PcrA
VLEGAAEESREFDPGEPSLDYSYGQVEVPEIAPGLRVRHPVFGPGSVLAVSGDGLGQKLRIRFERAGVKTVMVRYANLELG